jgi:hypothetical protein
VAQPGLKRGTFSPDWLIPVATTGTKDPYQPGLKAVFLLVILLHEQNQQVISLAVEQKILQQRQRDKQLGRGNIVLLLTTTK